MKKMLFIMFISVGLICSCHAYSIASERDEAYPALFEEICQIVEENFYDASLIQEQFPSIRAEYREQIATLSTPAEFSAMVNAMLGRLNSSHTYYLTPADYEYYHLAAVFAFLPAIQELSIGACGGVFVGNVAVSINRLEIIALSNKKSLFPNLFFIDREKLHP